MSLLPLRPLMAALLIAPMARLAGADMLLVENAELITGKPGEKPFLGYMEVGADGRIVAVAPGNPPDDIAAERTLDAAGKFVAPGFVSAHSHLHSSPFRGLGVDDTLYDWGKATGRLSKYETAEDAYWFTLHGTLDFLRNGITSVYDFTVSGATGGTAVGINERVQPAVLKPGPFEENQLRAKIDGGIRFVDGVGLAPVGTREEILSRFDRIYRYAQATYGANPLFLKMALSGGLQRAPAKETAFLEAEVMKKYGVLNHSHFLESPERVPEQQAKFYWYQEAGALGPNMIFGHFIQTNDEILRIAAAAGCAMSWQPTSNGRLGSGVADIVKYRAAGMRVGAGLDSAACTDTCDPFQNLRIGLALIRTKYKDATALSVEDMLYLHTLAAAEVLQVADKVGSLEPGKYADFLLVDPRDPETGPLLNPVAHYVYSCGLRNMKRVYVGGRLVIEGTRAVGQDEKGIRRQVDARMARLQELASAHDHAAAADVGAFDPSHRAE